MSVPALLDQYGKPIERAAVPTFQPGGWTPVVREPFTGAWQRNMEMRGDSVLANVAVFRCISLIAGDISKMCLELIEETAPDVWEETTSPAFSPVLTKPNAYQTRIQFIESWLNSKLSIGNAYILKERDGRGVVVGLYVLDPRRVRPLVADNGDVFYQLNRDNLAGLIEEATVPASEIIHDRWNCLYHPLVGLSPIWACGLSAMQGLRIQEHSTRFFANSANPGGFLTAPGKISNDTAKRIKDEWQQNFSNDNVGLVAVAGDGLKYEKLGVTALDSQLLEQLKFSAEMVCASYGVPGYKLGVATFPHATSIEALEQQYYQDCLQIHIESIELCLDEGLSLPNDYGVQFDLEGLLRMDSEAKMRMIQQGVQAGVLKPNDGRQMFGLGPVEGGDTPYLQVQNYSLAALAKRDSQENPVTPGAASPTPSTDSGAQDASGRTRAWAEQILRRAAYA